MLLCFLSDFCERETLCLERLSVDLTSKKTFRPVSLLVVDGNGLLSISLLCRAVNSIYILSLCSMYVHQFLEVFSEMKIERLPEMNT